MAEILIRAINNTGPTKERTDRLYKQGDPVVVRPDGWPWSDNEKSNRFWIVRVPSIGDTEAMQYLEPDNGRRRTWRLNAAALPGAVRTALDRGPVTLTRGQFLAAAERK